MNTKIPIEILIAHVELRAFEARKTMAEICVLAKIRPQVWSRAKSANRISVTTLRKVENAITDLGF